MMLGEARAAPDVVRAQLGQDEELYRALASRLRASPPSAIVTIARGSSDQAAGYFAYLVTARTGRLVTSLPMSLVTLYHAPLHARGILAVSVSQSGQSPDLIEPVRSMRAGGATTVALVNATGSPLAAAAEWVLPLHAGPEKAVAATKSFVASLTAEVRLAGHVFDLPALVEALKSVPGALEMGLEQDWSAAVDQLTPVERLMVISRGLGIGIAQEAALKFKETCGIQAEAFSAAEARHGPQELIEAGYPLMIFAIRGPAQADLVALASEMRERKARVLLAAPADVPGRDLTLVTTAAEELDPIAAIASFYPMVEALARARGKDPDQPRYLNKVTTTR
jgi:glucosamine--fructose-6-phosphate aminotransferase (isomerizing)